MGAGLKKTIISKILLGSSSGEGERRMCTRRESIRILLIVSICIVHLLPIERRGMCFFGRPFPNLRRALDQTSRSD